ncbi:MAG TPA: ABC transporter permease [Pyrinomonadaceae bacterium]|nr:ABC transporter permease [Pyrinomonadaceae bacterium]
MDSLIKDIRYAVRGLAKRPGFTLIAVLTLALGIGANTAIFSAINATLMRTPPVSDPDGLVFVFNGPSGSIFSYPDYTALRDQNNVFDGLIAWGGITASLNSNDQTDLVTGAIVSGNFFEVLGVRAQRGRLISTDDDKTLGAHPVVVISPGLWQKRFAGDPNVVGRQLLLNGNVFTVIGVLPAGFDGLQLGITRDLYVPMMMQATMRPPRAGYSGEMNPDLLQVRGNRWLFSVGRLKPGVTSPQAQSSLAVIAKQLEEAYPQTNRNRGISISALRGTDDPATSQQLSSVARLLMAVVGIVLLIACANVANLLLARSSSRTKEIAVRLAIGATRGRIVRQLLTEGVLLAILGGVAGLLLAWWTTRSLAAAPPPTGALPINPQFSIDLRVLLFTSGLSLLAGIVFGLAPALRASRPALIPALKDDAAAFFERTRTFSLKNLLVVMQVALSVVLLIAAGLFLRSLRQAQTIDPAFDSEKVVTLPLNINLLRYTRPQGRQFYTQVTERVEAIPGVESASVARIAAVSGNTSVRSLLIEGRTGSDNQFRSDGAGPAASDNTSVNANVIGPRYFQTMGIPLLQGRDFNAQDTEDHPRVVIVNEAFVRRHFPNEDAIGKRLSFSGPEGPWREIVGVVRTSKYFSLGEAPTPVAYSPLSQNHETGMTLHVRASVDPTTIAGAIRNEVQSLEKNLPLGNPERMSDRVANSLYAPRMGAILLAVFGGLALLLASIGLYGVMSFSVSRRTRELGIRVALGAGPGEVFRLVLRQGMTLVIAGVVIGLIAAVIVTRLLASFLYGVSTTDALTFTAVPVLLCLIALLACYLPARRATKVEPLIALRYE